MACGSSAPQDPPWNRSLQTAALQNSWDVHGFLGQRFFQWVDQEQNQWDYPTVRSQFTDRLVALLEDIGNAYLQPKTVFIGGGNAEYASAREVRRRTGLSVVPLRPSELEISPDLVPLLGCLRLSSDR